MEKRSVKISPVPTRTGWTTGETVELLIGPKEDQGKYVITDVTADHITLEAANQQPAGHTMTGMLSISAAPSLDLSTSLA